VEKKERTTGSKEWSRKAPTQPEAHLAQGKREGGTRVMDNREEGGGRRKGKSKATVAT